MDVQSSFNSVKEWWGGIELEKWFGSTHSEAIQVAIYFVSFFAIGFLFKKYLKFIFLCLIISFLIIKGLEYHKILEIDWESFNKLLGFEPTATFGTIANNALSWIKTNIVVAVASTLGFLIGYKLG